MVSTLVGTVQAFAWKLLWETVKNQSETDSRLGSKPVVPLNTSRPPYSHHQNVNQKLFMIDHHEPPQIVKQT